MSIHISSSIRRQSILLRPTPGTRRHHIPRRPSTPVSAVVLAESLPRDPVMASAAFLIAQYHATPLSHSRQRLRLRICLWLAPL
ncbi:MAG: hypothetical protein H6672_15280, partial [Anaerolineaceae bacterium]|nr:hypothetical protein [Anaerolineaceae bacterium]